jgi:hypothetical protein
MKNNWNEEVARQLLTVIIEALEAREERRAEVVQ